MGDGVGELRVDRSARIMRRGRCGETLRGAAERRHHDIRAGILWCIDRGMLQGDIDVDQRTDVLTHLVSPETYRFFVRERGWSDDLYREWLLGAIERLVLQP